MWICHNYVYLLGAFVAYRSYDVLATCPSHYAVVDHDDVLPVDYGSNGYDLPDDLFPTLIGRFDEAPETSLPPIPVFHQALFHRYPALLRISKSGGSSGVGNRYHNVCLERILPSKDSPELSSSFVDVVVFDLAARMGVVCVFKRAVLVRRFCKLCDCHTILVETDKVSRLNVSVKLSMQCS